jgi:hypothetical protein
MEDSLPTQKEAEKLRNFSSIRDRAGDDKEDQCAETNRTQQPPFSEVVVADDAVLTTQLRRMSSR